MYKLDKMSPEDWIRMLHTLKFYNIGNYQTEMHHILSVIEKIVN